MGEVFVVLGGMDLLQGAAIARLWWVGIISYVLMLLFDRCGTTHGSFRPFLIYHIRITERKTKTPLDKYRQAVYRRHLTIPMVQSRSRIFRQTIQKSAGCSGLQTRIFANYDEKDASECATQNYGGDDLNQKNSVSALTGRNAVLHCIFIFRCALFRLSFRQLPVHPEASREILFPFF